MPNRKAEEVAKSKPLAIVNQKLAVSDAIHEMAKCKTSACIIVDGKGFISGIFTERDLVRLASQGDNLFMNRPLLEEMTKNPRTVNGWMLLSHALHLMFEGGFRNVPVIDAYGRPIGLLSASDVLTSELLTFGKELAFRHEITELL